MLQEILLKIEVIEKRTIKVNVDLSNSVDVSNSVDGSIFSTDMWRIIYESGVTSEWKNANQIITLDSDVYEIEFKEKEGYNKPKNYICDLTEGKDIVITPIYTKKDYSNLTINFYIDEQYSKNLTWRLIQLEDKIIIDWNNDITNKVFIHNGNYQLQIKEFKKEETSTYNNIYDHITGELLEIPEFYIKAENIDIILTSDTIKSVSYNTSNLYLQGSNVCVTIQPNELEEIIKWRIKSNSNDYGWFKSGKTIYLPYKTYQIELTDCPGWNFTKSVNLTVDSSNKIFLVGIEGEENGNIRIKFEKQNIKDSARWRIVGTNVWYMDNEEISLVPDSYKIEFSQISNYVKPETKNFIVESGKLNVYTITYVGLGQLQLNITNLDKIIEFGIPYWKVKDTSNWRQSGTTVKLEGGTYTIEFNTVNNIYTRDDITVTVENEKDTVQDVTFDGLKIFAVPTKRGIQFFNYNNFETINILSNLNIYESINQIKFNKESTLLAIAQNNQPYLKLYDFINFTPYNDLYFKSPNGGCRSIDFSNDKKYLVVSHNNYPYLTIYNTLDWSTITINTPPSNVCNSVKFSPNDTYLTVVFDKSPYVIVYETINFNSIFTIELNKEVLSVDYSPTERFLVLGCTDDIILFDMYNSFIETTIDLTPKIIKGSIFSTHFYDNYLIIVTSLSFNVYYCIFEDNKYKLTNTLSESISNVNNYSIITPDNKYFIIGCSNYPYMLVYKTSDWSRVTDFNYINNYCKKFDISGDMSAREFIYTPSNTYPANSYKGFKETEKLKGSDFKYRKLVEDDTHIASQWRLLTEDLEIVHDSDECSSLIEYSLPIEYFINNKNYFWQVRYKSQTIGWSFWSYPTSFMTLETYIQKPVNISPTNKQEDVDEIPTFVSSIFTPVNTTDTHVKSQWRILEYSKSLLFESGAIDDLISFTLPPGILRGSTDSTTYKYYWQVQHKGLVEGWSAWSDPTEFATAIWIIEKPVNISPSDNEEQVNGLNLVLTSSEYITTSLRDIHTNSRYEIYFTDQNSLVYSSGELVDDRMGTELTFEVPGDKILNNNYTYRWRVSYKGSVLGWSEWSDSTVFKSQPKGMSRISIATLPPPEDTMLLPNRNNIPLRWNWTETNQTTTSQYYPPEDSDQMGSNYIDIESGKEIVVNFEDYPGLINPAPITVNLLSNNIYRYIGVYGVSLGSLQVNISGTSLGKWKIVSTEVWRDSGYIERNLVFNVYEIEFKDVAGFITPENITAVVKSTELLTLETVTYTVDPNQIYHLLIEIDGNSEGRWKLDSEPEDTWHINGDKIDLITNSVDLIKFKEIDEYITPDNITIQANDLFYNAFEEVQHPTQQKTFYYKRTYLEETKYGFLIVELTPASGGWKLDGESVWRNSDTKQSVPSGEQTIIFKDLAGYTKPENSIVTIVEEQTLVKQFSYTKILIFGSIQVTLTPVATWQIKNEQTETYLKVNGSEIINSNTVVDQLVVGEKYIIEYKKLSGYSSMLSDKIDVKNTNLITIDKKYKVEGETGHVKGIINIDDGRWKLKDTIDWYKDEELIDFEEGIQVFEFYDVSGYTTPINQTLTIVKDKTITLEGVYSQVKIISDCIELTINPDSLYSNNNVKYRTRYRANSSSEYGNWSDWIVYFKSLVNGVLTLNNRIMNPKNGIHQIEFKNVSGYNLNEATKQVEYSGKGLNVSFDYGGARTSDYGDISIILAVLDQDGNQIMDISGVEKILEIKHAVISDDTYTNKKFSDIVWDNNWTKYEDFSNVYSKLSTKVKHAFKIKSIESYINNSEYGNIYFANYGVASSIVLNISLIYFTRKDIKFLFDVANS